MYTVIIKSNSHGYEYNYQFKTEKQARKKWAAWYNHGLDYSGQLSETLDIFDPQGVCIFSDMF